MQNQWDNLMHHIMGITAAMEVWSQNASSSSSHGGDTCSGDVHMDTAAEEEDGTPEEKQQDQPRDDHDNMGEESGKGGLKGKP